MKKLHKTIFFSILLLVIPLLVVAAPTNLNLDLIVSNTTGTESGQHNPTIRVYDACVGGSVVHTQVVNISLDSQGIGHALLTNIDLKEDGTYCLSIQGPGDTESNRINVSGVLQAQRAANATYADTAGNTTFSATANYDDLSNQPTINGSSTTDELQNLYETVDTDSGSAVADTTTDTLTVAGSGTVSTSASGDTVTITGTAHTTDTDTWNTTAQIVDSVIPNMTGGTQTGLTVAHDNDFFTFILDAVNNVITTFNNFIQFDVGIGAPLANFTNMTATNGTFDRIMEGANRFPQTISCGGTDKISAFASDGTYTCTSDESGGGGGAGDKWVDNGTFISPNSTFADDVLIPGSLTVTDFVNASTRLITNNITFENDTSLTLDLSANGLRTDVEFSTERFRIMGATSSAKFLMFDVPKNANMAFQFAHDNGVENILIDIPIAGTDLAVNIRRSVSIGCDDVNATNCTKSSYLDFAADGTGADLWIQDDLEVNGSMYGNELNLTKGLNTSELCIGIDCTTNLPNASSETDEIQDLSNITSGDFFNVTEGVGNVNFTGLGSCSAGTSIRVINADGTVTCETDDTSVVNTAINDTLLFENQTEIKNNLSQLRGNQTVQGNNISQLRSNLSALNSTSETDEIQDLSLFITNNSNVELDNLNVSNWDNVSIQEIQISDLSHTTDTDTFNTTEQMQDSCWGFSILTGTQTGLTVTYQDGTDDVDFVIDPNLNVTQLNATNFTGQLSCADIYGGTDGDFCADADSGGGAGGWTVETDKLSNATLGVSFTPELANFTANLTVGQGPLKARFGSNGSYYIFHFEDGDVLFNYSVNATFLNDVSILGTLSGGSPVKIAGINISDNVFTLTENLNGSSRFTLRNLNGSSNATAVMSTVNDVGGSMSIGVGSSGFFLGIIPYFNVTALFSRSRGDMLFANLYNQTFRWLINTEDDNDATKLVEVMSLDSEGLTLERDFNLTTGTLYLTNSNSIPPGPATVVRRNNADGAIFGVGNNVAGNNPTSGAAYILIPDGGNYTIDAHSSLDSNNPNQVVHHLRGALSIERWRLNSTNVGSFVFENGLDSPLMIINSTGDVTIPIGNLTIGSSTVSANFTMFSPDLTEYTCGVTDAGVFECS